MSVYNGEPFLEKAIDSILKQRFEQFEFLIMDDGSTDDSLAIINNYAEKDRRVKVFTQENKGLAKSLNTLIKSSKGRYIARMDADDISEPERLKNQFDFMEERPDYALVVGGSLIIDNDDNIINGKYLINNNDNLRKMLFLGKKNPFTHGAIMFRKSCLDTLGMVYRFQYSQDFDLLLRLACRFKIASNEKILYRYRFGSALQLDVEKAKKRLRQKELMLNALSCGKLFDDSYCINLVGDIYNKDFDMESGATSNLPLDNYIFELRALLLSSKTMEFRKKTIQSIYKYGINKKLFLLFLISLFPRYLSFRFHGIYLKYKNSQLGNNIYWLSFSELSSYSPCN